MGNILRSEDQKTAFSTKFRRNERYPHVDRLMDHPDHVTVCLILLINF